MIVLPAMIAGKNTIENVGFAATLPMFATCPGRAGSNGGIAKFRIREGSVTIAAGRV
jgi:hypothetical protein